jgi:hypothetical protein
MLSWISYSTVEYLGLWEKLNNLNFKPHIYVWFKLRKKKLINDELKI